MVVAILVGAAVGVGAPLAFVASFVCQKAKAAFFLSSAVDIYLFNLETVFDLMV